METFTKAKGFVNDPDFPGQRRKALEGLDINTIDKPIKGIIGGFAELPYCFTLQSCWGHFVYGNNQDPHNLDPLPVPGPMGDIEYRIAYIALCIRDNPQGRRLFETLSDVPNIDYDYIQFGSPGWFWENQVNSYALQVEPLRFSNSDTAIIGYEEALHIERLRKHFFGRLQDIINKIV